MKKRIVCMILTLCLLFACGVPACAVNEYLHNARWKETTGSGATAMYNDGDKFILYCYRAGCTNSRYIGENVVTPWMDTYGWDVYGVNVDAADSVPSWVWQALGVDSATLPFVAFANGGSARAYTPVREMHLFADLLEREFASFCKEPVAKDSLFVRTLPDKSRYTVGDTLDTAGLTLLFARADGTEQTVSDGFICTGFASDAPGVKTVTVTYGGLQTAFTVRVNSPEGKPSIWIDEADETALQYGDPVILTADYDNLPSNAHVEWSCTYRTLFGKRTQSGAGTMFSLTLKGLSKTVTVRAAMTAPDGSAVTDADGNAVIAQRSVTFRNNMLLRLQYNLQRLLHRLQII